MRSASPRAPAQLSELEPSPPRELLARLAPGARVIVQVRGRSMQPLLREGDRLEVVCRRELRRGAIYVVFDDFERLLAHRLVSIEPAGVRLKGDANAGPDRLLPADALLGEVVARLREGRRTDLTTSVWRLRGVLRAVAVDRAFALRRRARSGAVSLATGRLRPATEKLLPLAGPVGELPRASWARALKAAQAAGCPPGPLPGAASGLFGAFAASGAIVAFAEVERTEEGEAKVHFVHVRAAYRGRGLGRALLVALRAWAEARGALSLTLPHHPALVALLASLQWDHGSDTRLRVSVASREGSDAWDGS